MGIQEIKNIANTLADANDSDIYLYSGSINSRAEDDLIEKCSRKNRRENAILILSTYGGEPDAGYKISRIFQQKYKKFTVVINGSCKSAGTLITVGANEIVMGDRGEIGPLDVQIGKKDELGETDSGLTVLSAIKALEEKTFELFETSFLNLKTRSSGRITLKSAMEMASKLAVGTMSPVMAQIDPMHVGGVSRAMNIGLEYGKRLGDHSKNCKRDTLSRLAESYPSHSFVIDRDEVKQLFINVREPSALEASLLDEIGVVAINPQSELIFELLNDVQPIKTANTSNGKLNDTKATKIALEVKAKRASEKRKKTNTRTDKKV